MSASKAVFRKNETALWAVDAEARAILQAIKNGRDVMVTVKPARNPGQHRLFFAVLQKVVDSGAWPYSVETLLEWVKFKVGHVERVEFKGKAFTLVKSIAFESLPQDQFQRFFERAIFHLCAEITGEGLREEIAEMVDGRYGECDRLLAGPAGEAAA